MATDKIVLPTDEELTVTEVNVSYTTLQAAAFHLGKYCEWKQNEYLLCREEEGDLTRCVNEGKALTACAIEFFRQVKKTCYNEFNQYARCIDKSSGMALYEPCRKTQAVFDKCMLDNMNLERPGYGYFCQAKVHHTKRPKPKIDAPTFDDVATPKLSDDAPMPPPAYGSRVWFKW